MKFSQMFPSRFVKAADLDGQKTTTKIAGVVSEQMPDGKSKPALKFIGGDKMLVMNRTNAETLARAYGDDTDNWTGKPVTLKPAVTMFQGKEVECVRLEVPAGPVPAPTADPNEDGQATPADATCPF